ncbi:unnamed protein product [Jaminaea pallidilutea]
MSNVESAPPNGGQRFAPMDSEYQAAGAGPGINGKQYQGGTGMSQSVTPGGHQINDELLAIGTAPRKIANPLPLGVLSFATTTTLLSFYNVGIRGIATPNVILTFALFYGGLTQFLAGLWEFASGNTFGATVFVAFGCFWEGFAMIFIPFFGEMGEYSGQPGVYSMTGVAASEAESAIGLYLWIWFGITTVLLFGSLRSSIALISLLFFLDLTFACLAAYYYTGNTALETAGGALGIITGFNAFYLGAGSFLTSYTSYVTLPLGSVAVKD